MRAGLIWVGKVLVPQFDGLEDERLHDKTDKLFRPLSLDQAFPAIIEGYGAIRCFDSDFRVRDIDRSVVALSEDIGQQVLLIKVKFECETVFRRRFSNIGEPGGRYKLLSGEII